MKRSILVTAVAGLFVGSLLMVDFVVPGEAVAAVECKLHNPAPGSSLDGTVSFYWNAASNLGAGITPNGYQLFVYKKQDGSSNYEVACNSGHVRGLGHQCQDPFNKKDDHVALVYAYAPGPLQCELAFYPGE